MKSLGYVHIPSVDHHRWSRISRRSMSTGKGEFNRTTRLMLHQMRWRKPPRQYGLNVTAWVGSILIHLLVAVAMLLFRPYLPQPITPEGKPNAIQVRFIEAHPPPPPPPPVPQPPQRHAPRRTAMRHAPAPPSRAPNLAPVPMAPASRPNIKLDTAMTPPDMHETPQQNVQTVQAVQPPREPRQAPPAPPAPAPPAPPPPRVVMEKSKMALPPPQVTLEQQAPVQVESEHSQPVPVPRPKLVQGVPEIKVQVDEAPPVSLQPVPAPRVVAPAPQPEIDVGPSHPVQHIEAAPRKKIQVTEAPDVRAVQAPREVALQPIPAAPEKAPRVHIEANRMQVPDTTTEKPVLENLPQVRPEVSASPVKNVAKATPPSRTHSAQKTQESWVHPNDRFSTLPQHPGHGTAEKSRQGKGSKSGVPDFVQVQPHGNSDVMTRRYRRLDYKPTIFAKYWAPDNQDLLTEWMQKLVDTLSFTKTFDLGRGVRIHCGGWLLGFGCGGDPPSPPSSKSDDPRLNMAPAQPLVPGLGSSAPSPPVKPPKSSHQSVECETARVSGAPLPPGCAVESNKPYESDQWKHPQR